ncbi:MAG: hypothetical protein CSA05_03275 [Bacteroidia bacterium]|nr:MAG: hypothetical protein CSA05_03275 [Bacteroidia bacterium]
MKLHSWSIDAMDRNPKFSLSIDNILTNFKANMGAVYNTNEKKVNYFGDILYSKWFVEIGLHAKIQNRGVNYFSSYDKLDTEIFDEANYGVSLSVPLNWNRGSYDFIFTPKVQYAFHKTNNYEDMPVLRENLNFGSITSGLTFAATKVKAIQHIYPRLGIAFDAQYQKSLKESVNAEVANATGTLFLPALMQNHGIKIDAAWKKELTSNNFTFVDNFDYSRGYEAIPNDELYKLSFNYALPLLYPDWGFAGITYFKRIRANLFYDMSKVKYYNKTTDQNSYGMELFFDNTVFNLIPISFGFRESFLINKDVLNSDRKNNFEVVVQMSF